MRGFEINISFDGTGCHDWMRGVPGAEERTLRALKLCHEHGFHTSVSMCIHRGNKDTIPQTVETLRSVGATELKTAHVDETDLWRRHSEGNDLTWQEYVDAMLPYIEWYYEAGRPIESLEFGGIAR